MTDVEKPTIVESISANDPILRTTDPIIVNEYNKDSDGTLYRGSVFGGLFIIILVIISMTMLSYFDKTIPDNFTSLPVAIFGFISGIFFGRSQSFD